MIEKIIKVIPIVIFTIIFICINPLADTYDFSNLTEDIKSECERILSENGEDALQDFLNNNGYNASDYICSNNSDERINAIETKLDELGISIEDLEDKYDLYELQQESLNDKLDTLIIIISEFKDSIFNSINDVNNNTPLFEILNNQFDSVKEDTLLSKDYLYKLLHLTYRDETDFEYPENFTTINECINEVGTIVENSLQASSERTLTELNKTLLVTNKFLTYLMVLLLIGVCLMIAFWIGKLIHNILNRNVY